MKWSTALAATAVGLGAVAARDALQRKHTLLRNFPLIGHGRYLLESIGPELRQYIITDNDQERPFSRDQRRWVYSSAKQENSYFGFGTDNDLEFVEGYPVIKHRTFSSTVAPSGASTGLDARLPAGKVVGGPRKRTHAFRPNSVINISAMSFGSLSAPAISALNQGAAAAGCMHNTGEGGLSAHHRQGGDLVFQIGTAYFGCRDEDGRFSLPRLQEVVASAPVRMIEIKLSQGAKPGLGGMLPGAKVSAEIAEVRGIPEGQDCASPSRHTEFDTVDQLLDFVERIAGATGLPVGIKSAVGDLTFWEDLVAAMVADPGRGVDFITIDGGEGGTGAAPLVFSDSVALPFRLAFTRVYRLFAEAGITDRVMFIGSGRLGLPDHALTAFALGVDMINVAREAMLSIGCIQAQKCHTDRCPTGVATQDKWLSRGLDAQLKSVRAANYIRALRRDLIKVSTACGVLHPALITADDIELADGHRSATPLSAVYDYQPGWGLPSAGDLDELTALMVAEVPQGSTGADRPVVENPGQ